MESNHRENEPEYWYDVWVHGGLVVGVERISRFGEYDEFIWHTFHTNTNARIYQVNAWALAVWLEVEV